MADPETPKLRTAPIVCGGAYRKTLPPPGPGQEPLVIEGLILATRTLADGRKAGELKVFRERTQVVTENHEDFEGWVLVGLPRELDTPMGSERLLLEVERLKGEKAELEARLAKEQEAETDERIVKMRDEDGMEWGAIGRELDIHHNTAKSRYLKAVKG